MTAGAAGYVNLSWEDEITLNSSTAGGAGQDGEFVFAVTQYDSAGGSLRSWVYEHGISDPITTAQTFPFSLSTGLTPVSMGDYFTFNFAFSATQANKNARFTLPADNAGLDERIEFFYFPVTSLGQGPKGDKGDPGTDGTDGADGADGADGVTTWLALTDTPTAFTADKWVKVNTAGNALELVDAPQSSGGLSTVASDTTISGTGAVQVLLCLWSHPVLKSSTYHLIQQTFTFTDSQTYDNGWKLTRAAAPKVR